MRNVYGSNSTKPDSVIGDIRWSKQLWPGQISNVLARQLADLLQRHRLSVLSGDIQLLDGKWYVTNSGLLGLAARHRCCGIRIRPVREFCDISVGRWVFEATVFKSRTCRGFVGYGDADPSNVSPLVHGAEMRIAETRATSRALRKAFGIGICSVEEIGTIPKTGAKLPSHSTETNGNGTGPKVRDRLCQIIRQHGLDPELVKAYAVDFCGTKTLKEATRKQVENFVQQLADCAEKDRDALLRQLSSYVHPKSEVIA